MHDCRLLAIPIEARLRIYHHYFDIRYRPTDVAWVNVDTQTGRRLVKQDIWSLFLVCKQIYDESMPEYYARTCFHFNALVTLQNIMKFHKNFNTHARHLVFNPQLLLPEAENLLELKNLHTFAITNLSCFEPVGTAPEQSLAHSTLRTALYQDLGKYADSEKMKRALQLHESLAKVTGLHKRQIHLLIRFGYTYVEKTKHPDTWGGKSARRYRIIEYDVTDDVFVIIKPDRDEKAIIRAS